jgi:hypothetical protein
LQCSEDTKHPLEEWIKQAEGKTPAVGMEEAKRTVVAQIEKIQGVLRFAQTVKSKQNE